jgi:hypothetical protein
MNIASLVQKATDPRNPMEDWDSILQICDTLSQRPDETYVLVILMFALILTIVTNLDANLYVMQF